MVKQKVKRGGGEECKQATGTDAYLVCLANFQEQQQQLLQKQQQQEDGRNALLVRPTPEDNEKTRLKNLVFMDAPTLLELISTFANTLLKSEDEELQAFLKTHKFLVKIEPGTPVTGTPGGGRRSRRKTTKRVQSGGTSLKTFFMEVFAKRTSTIVPEPNPQDYYQRVQEARAIYANAQYSQQLPIQPPPAPIVPVYNNWASLTPLYNTINHDNPLFQQQRQEEQQEEQQRQQQQEEQWQRRWQQQQGPQQGPQEWLNQQQDRYNNAFFQEPATQQVYHNPTFNSYSYGMPGQIYDVNEHGQFIHQNYGHLDNIIPQESASLASASSEVPPALNIVNTTVTLMESIQHEIIESESETPVAQEETEIVADIQERIDNASAAYDSELFMPPEAQGLPEVFTALVRSEIVGNAVKAFFAAVAAYEPDPETPSGKRSKVFLQSNQEVVRQYLKHVQNLFNIALTDKTGFDALKTQIELKNTEKIVARVNAALKALTSHQALTQSIEDYLGLNDLDTTNVREQKEIAKDVVKTVVDEIKKHVAILNNSVDVYTEKTSEYIKIHTARKLKPLLFELQSQIDVLNDTVKSINVAVKSATDPQSVPPVIPTISIISEQVKQYYYSPQVLFSKFTILQHVLSKIFRNLVDEMNTIDGLQPSEQEITYLRYVSDVELIKIKEPYAEYSKYLKIKKTESGSKNLYYTHPRNVSKVYIIEFNLPDAIQTREHGGWGQKRIYIHLIEDEKPYDRTKTMVKCNVYYQMCKADKADHTLTFDFGYKTKSDNRYHYYPLLWFERHVMGQECSTETAIDQIYENDGARMQIDAIQTSEIMTDDEIVTSKNEFIENYKPIVNTKTRNYLSTLLFHSQSIKYLVKKYEHDIQVSFKHVIVGVLKTTATITNAPDNTFDLEHTVLATMDNISVPSTIQLVVKPFYIEKPKDESKDESKAPELIYVSNGIELYYNLVFRKYHATTEADLPAIEVKENARLKIDWKNSFKGITSWEKTETEETFSPSITRIDFVNKKIYEPVCNDPTKDVYVPWTPPAQQGPGGGKRSNRKARRIVLVKRA